MLKKASLSFGLVFLLLMQIAALAADPFFEVDSTESDLNSHDHRHSPFSITLEDFDDKRFNLELFSLFDAEVIMGIESTHSYQSDISDEEVLNIFANLPVDFSVSLNNYDDQFEVILVVTATTIEGYYFREQLTLTNEVMYEPRCKYEFSMAEAIENDCASQPVSEIDISAGKFESETNSIVETYSVAVQNAFSRFSDMSQYDTQNLRDTVDWLVVTDIPIETHLYSSARPDYSEPAPLLGGSYIWSFDDPSMAPTSLKQAMEAGEIETYYPLIKSQSSLRFAPNDSLYGNQWHLDNTAQYGGTSGEDANITGVWDYYNGSGVVISIIDDGLQSNHPDLSSNFNLSLSWNWCLDLNDPSPWGDNAHGTAAAGVAAAAGNNEIDVMGAAFGATLSGQLLIACSSTDAMEASALSYYNNVIDIYSNSWGPIDDGETLSAPGALTLSALEDDMLNGRGGLGNIIVWAAGNGLAYNDNSNYDGYANSRYTIAVTAIDHNGIQSWYAEPGANILVAAHSSGGSPNVGITTTDITGSAGYNNSVYGNTTDTFGGTSSATPLVSGIIALMLEANENLTWRDVQHIIVNSARKNDPSDSSWGVNGVGYDVSHKYGFGVIDAGATVALAENWTSVDDEATALYGPYNPSVAIPDNSSSWTEFSTYVSAGIQVETTEVTVDIEHFWRGDLDIVLVSPSGTESWLAEGSITNSGQNFENWTFSTVHNWGEQSTGTWTLKVRDTDGGFTGTLNSWSLNIFGISNPLYVTGVFEYEDREFDETGFTGVNPYLPIRGADIEIIDNSTGAVLANTYTNNLGQFNASISLTSPSDIYARVKSTSTQNPGLFNHSVMRTPSTGGTVYTLTSQIFSNVVPGTNIDFTSSPVRANSSDVAGAFNIFDMSEYSESYMENLTSQVAPMDLTLYWTSGAGSSGYKFYDLQGNVYLCGHTDDDDSYDDVVILHEIGHYIHLVYSANPSFYGSHSLTGTYDLRLGFTEGVGTYFAGAIRQYMGLEKPLIYIETTGVNLRFWGFSMATNTDIIAGYSGSTFTAMDAGNEATVGHVMFDLIDNTNTLDGSTGVDDDSISLPSLVGDQMVWNVFIALKDNETSSSSVNDTRITLETFYDYWNILYPNYATDFQQILLDHDIEYKEDSLESDDSSLTATWIETDGSLYSHSFYPAGDNDWSKFNATSGDEWLIKTRNLANGVDTILQIYDTDGSTLLATNDDATNDVVSSAIQFTAPADGIYFVKSYRYQDTIPIGRYGNYDLTVTYINHPSISSTSPSFGSVEGGYNIEVLGSNFESGATVMFGAYNSSQVIWNNASSLTVLVPANIPGYSDVKIYNPENSDGITPQVTISNLFEYTGTPLDPVINSISPNFGDYTSSTEVIITGDYLIDGLTTNFGSTQISSITVVDAKTIQATIQPLSKGVHTIKVINPNGAYSSMINGFESTLTEINSVGSNFNTDSPLQDSISITENVRISDLYVHVNVSHPIVPAKLNLTLETPTGQMISIFDEIQVTNETFYWESGFDSIFGYDNYPSEALYQLKGQSSLGGWTLHASSSSDSTNTLHSWGLTFLEYRHRDHAEQVYCAAEYRNHVMSLDSSSGDLLFRSQYEGTFGNDVAISADGRILFAAAGSYNDGNTFANSIISTYDTWTGAFLNSYQLTGYTSVGSLAPVSNGDLLVVTSSQLYLIDISNQAITGNVSLNYHSNWENYAVDVNPTGTTAYVTNKAESILQTYSLSSMTNAGNMSTGLYSPFDVDISSDGSFGVIGYDEGIIQVFQTSGLSVNATYSADTRRSQIDLISDDSEVYMGVFQVNAGFTHVDLQTGVTTRYDSGYDSTNGLFELNNRMYISEWGDNSIIVWDTKTMTEVNKIDLTPIDGWRCRGITAVEPQGMLSPSISATSTDLVLSWNAPSSGPAVSEYIIYKGDSPGNESFYSSVPSSSLSYTDTSASSTALSYYRVSSVMTGLGEGPISTRMIGAPGADLDGDGISDLFDDDTDGDGTLDVDDPFPLDSSEDTDTDGDGIGNNADTDDDGDSWTDTDELACSTDPVDSTSIPADADSDGICDEVDTDDDGDGTPDADDPFPLDSSENTDTDGDGIGNNADTDDDGDGTLDVDDPFPLDSSEDTDTDGDGIGNNADTDDDGDGWTDTDELACITDPVDSTSIPADADSDGICDEVDTDRTVSGFQSGSVFTDASLSARGKSTCAILENASLQCWGSNSGSKLGTGSDRSNPTAADLGTGLSAVATAVGYYNSCSILDDGSVKCWGQNNGGSSGTTINIGSGRIAVTITAGFDYACAILDDASLICWGSNGYGQLGDGTTTSASTSSPVTVDIGTGRTAVAVAAGHYHTCAILDNASLYCWGDNAEGKLGDGTTTTSSTPVGVDLGTGRSAVAISAGGYHTCAILDDASIKCWGINNYGNLGDGTTESTCESSCTPPVSVDLGTGRTAIAISLGITHSCAILDDNSLKCWGYGRNGELGRGSYSDSSTPVLVSLPSSRTAVAVAAGQTHTCAILDNLSVQCWGDNRDGQLGIGFFGSGTNTEELTPVYVNLSGNLAAVSERDLDEDGTLNIFDTHMKSTSSYIATGERNTCAVLGNASLYCWGDNFWGQIGDGSNSGSTTPVAVSLPTGRTVDSVAVGYSHACAILDNSSLYCWGANNQGQLGDGSSTDSNTPIAVSLPIGRTATMVSAGVEYTCVVLDDASLYCWGNNGYGQLGDGTTTARNTPVAVSLPSGRTTSSVDAGRWHTCAVLDDASLYCWGKNGYGELGDGSNFASTTPVSVSLPSGRTAETVSAGQSYTCAVLDNLSLYCWGYNGHGQLGDGSYSDSNLPVEVSLPSGRTSSSVSTGVHGFTSAAYTCAILDDSSLYCWGNNANGGLGDGSNTNTNTPVAVNLPNGRTADSVSVSRHTCAALDNSSLYCWGVNNLGQLGDGSTSARNTPGAVNLPAGGTMKTLDLDVDGDGVIDSNDDFLDNPARSINCPAGSYGRYVCIDSSAGYYVDNTGSTSQTECAVGTYQPSTGQSSCIDASAGYYVDSTASISQTACPAGTYNLNIASTSSSACNDVGAGYYTSSSGSASQIACSLGTYQPTAGQISCIDASAGYYVDLTASTNQWTCTAGTYQPSTGQSSCVDASAGYYVPSPASTTQTACTTGTYQPNTGQSSCTDASAGYYVDSVASTTQTACAVGTYQPSSAQLSCTDASAGYYVPSTASTSQTACILGTYQDSSGQSSCIDAFAGYYVPSTASTTQTACAAGTYQPSTGQSSCIDASAGYYVDTTASTTQTACSAGTYNPNTASSSSSACTDASAGYYVGSAGSASQTPCAAGTYQPSTGQSSCIDSSAGYYVDTTAST
ncbi:S8 family serine peptidase, partial [Euryarchaeota archaeon]|nr:S8 family serine peptidase [Euryarchaeota archaeon]